MIFPGSPQSCRRKAAASRRSAAIWRRHWTLWSLEPTLLHRSSRKHSAAVWWRAYTGGEESSIKHEAYFPVANKKFSSNTNCLLQVRGGGCCPKTVFGSKLPRPPLGLGKSCKQFNQITLRDLCPGQPWHWTDNLFERMRSQTQR